MKRNSLLFMLCLCLLLAGGIWMRGSGFGTQHNGEPGTPREEGNTRVQLTVWLDDDNEWEVRQQVELYEAGKAKAAGAGLEASFPDVRWNLVAKNYLTPAQYREELASALEKGEGPDFIYMDACSGVDPEEMMESGAFLELGDVTKRLQEKLRYADGVLEAGIYVFVPVQQLLYFFHVITSMTDSRL